jgi:alpha,alpha-trehalase
VLEGFKALGDYPGKEEIRHFVSSHFAPVASEMKPYNITTSGPLAWSDKVDDAKYRGWADVLHQSWAKLAFQFDTSSLCDGCVSSTLPVKRPFVVPGGRFREFYYWDSYFVIEGLLQSGLNSLALDMIENFLDFVDTYGFMRKLPLKIPKWKFIHTPPVFSHFSQWCSDLLPQPLTTPLFDGNGQPLL